MLNVLAGGPQAGAHLVSHPGVDKVAFTGSTAAGRTIAEVCGRLLRPVTLELGGKSAAIILDDADLDATVKGLRSASFVNNGQTCHLSSRILAPRSRYAEVVDAVAALAENLVVGDPLQKSTDIGPLVSRRQQQRVLDYIEVGRQEAKLVAGGGVPADQSQGWFVAPTVFADVDNSARIAQEEIFGPVLAVIRTTPISRPSISPTTASSGWAARCGPPMSSGPPRSPAPCAPVPSASTNTSWTSTPRSAA